MAPRMTMVVGLLLTALLVATDVTAQKVQPAPARPDSPDTNARYRLFETTNRWTFVLLDTASGRAWQVEYSLDESPAKRMTINDSSLLPDGANPRNGRFTLYRTQNTYNFLLLDQEDSRIWQIQWALEAKDRGIVGTIPLRK